MDPMMQIFFLLWMFILPILGILSPILSFVIWFFIVPRIARTLTYKRFSPCSWHLIADDSGYAYLIATREEMPEGIVDTKKGWRFLPRPSWLKRKTKTKTKTNGGKKIDVDEAGEDSVERTMLRPFVWKDVGKPIWIGYAGKVVSTNPATMAGLQQTPFIPREAKTFIESIIKYVKVLAQPHRKELTDKLNELAKGLNFREITMIDPTIIKKLFPRMYTPSQLDAFGTNRELRGMKRAGKQYTPLILGIGFIAAMLIIAIVAIGMLR